MKIFLIGGFLGSGKTTAIRHACATLIKNGTRVGVITNDQGQQLVDTAFLENTGVPTLEVSNGCFCCNYNKLDNSIQQLIASYNPEIVFAESVGSCTDLIATVVKPLQNFRPDIEVVVSVFADSSVLPVLIKGSQLFVNSVNYIYKKQLEEADIIVVNKIDLVTEKQLEELQRLLPTTYPGKTIIYQNSLQHHSISNWIETLNSFCSKDRHSLDIDYNLYAAGEAELGWYDSAVEIISLVENAADEGWQLIYIIHSRIMERGLSIGHLKFLLDDGNSKKKVSFTPGSESRNAKILNGQKVDRITLLINARIQATPELITEIVSEAIAELKGQTNCLVKALSLSAFKPGFPRPQHRILN